MSLFHRRDPAIEKLLELYRSPDRYRPVRELGEGGLAKVSACFDTYLSRVVALKELKESNLENSFLVRSFLNEARMVGYLNHPGIVAVFDTFILDKGRVCYTMTMVEGQSLANILDSDDLFRKGPRMSMVKALDVITRVVETMAYAHERGVMHLDIKPENIMVGTYGDIKLMDWGNARLHDPEPYRTYLKKFTADATVENVDPERRNVVFGTPLYMSPEQTRTPRDMLTLQTDIFAAGAVFYELLTGARAFQSDTAQGAMEKVRTFEPPPVHEINRDVPLRLSQIVEKMLAKDMAGRYTSFRDVLADLEELNESGLAFSTRKFESGEVIFAEGDAGEYAFSVVSGTVEISKQSDSDKKVLAILGPGEIIGELAVFTDHPRTATATALETTEIRIMGAGEVKKELEKLRPWVGTMIRALSERFIGLNEKLVKLGRDD